MTEFVKLISKVIFASQDWHGGDAVSLLEAPERLIQHFDGQEIDIAVPYRYSRCCPPDEAETLYLLNALLFGFSAHTWRGRCPPGRFIGVRWSGNAVNFRVLRLASGQPGGGSGGAEL